MWLPFFHHSLGVLGVELELSLGMGLRLYRNISHLYSPPMPLGIFMLIERSLHRPFWSVTFMFTEICFTQGLKRFSLALSGLAYLNQI